MDKYLALIIGGWVLVAGAVPTVEEVMGSDAFKKRHPKLVIIPLFSRVHYNPVMVEGRQPSGMPDFDGYKQIFWNVCSKPPDQTMDDRRVLAGWYKVHLMPKPAYFVETIARIGDKLSSDDDFMSCVAEWKVLGKTRVNGAIGADQEDGGVRYFLDKMGNVLALIVIYVMPGKAQQFIDMLAPLLSGIPGVQGRDLSPELQKAARVGGDDPVVPRFNIALTDRRRTFVSPLIYYAQGNADDKLMPTYYRAGITERICPACRLVKRDGYIDDILAKDLLYDETENFALYRPDFLGARDDFHLYMRSRSGETEMREKSARDAIGQAYQLLSSADGVQSVADLSPLYDRLNELLSPFSTLPLREELVQAIREARTNITEYLDRRMGELLAAHG